MLTQHIAGECGCTPRSVHAEANAVNGNYLDVEVLFEEADLAKVTDLVQTWTDSWNAATGNPFFDDSSCTK